MKNVYYHQRLALFITSLLSHFKQTRDKQPQIKQRLSLQVIYFKLFEKLSFVGARLSYSILIYLAPPKVSTALSIKRWKS
ncbi:hypothetical protein Misp06_03763 [Microbulbifer sp. NBRC 101763]